MARRVRLYLVGSLVLVALAGCGRGFLQTAEREPWRAEAEAAPPLSPAQALQPSARGGDGDQFERAVLLLAQSLAEDLAERRARQDIPRADGPADEDGRGTSSPPLEGAGTR